MFENIYAIHVSLSLFKADCHVESASCHICNPSRSDMISISTWNARNECVMAHLPVCPDFGGACTKRPLSEFIFGSCRRSIWCL